MVADAVGGQPTLVRCICVTRSEKRQLSAYVQVYTAGGGAQNAKWMAMRAAKLGVPVEASPQTAAAYGAALLARQGWRQRKAQQGQHSS
jgi:sugar (pentulose or hexulose) kinase